MTKYIHYSVSVGEFDARDFLISDNASEEGFILFIEFTCENVDAIIDEVVSGYRMKVESQLVKGETPLFFQRVLTNEMAEEKENLKTPYTMKIHYDDYVAVYSRTIEE